MLRSEFKAEMVLTEITRNCGNYPYSNYVGNAPVGKVPKHIETENALLVALSI